MTTKEKLEIVCQVAKSLAKRFASVESEELVSEAFIRHRAFEKKTPGQVAWYALADMKKHLAALARQPRHEPLEAAGFVSCTPPGFRLVDNQDELEAISRGTGDLCRQVIQAWLLDRDIPRPVQQRAMRVLQHKAQELKRKERLRAAYC